MKRLQFMAVMGAIFLLVTAIADAFVKLETLDYLIFHVWWFWPLVLAILWAISFAFIKRDD